MGHSLAAAIIISAGIIGRRWAADAAALADISN